MLRELLGAGLMLAVSVAIHAAVIARLLRTLTRAAPAPDLRHWALTARLFGVAARLIASHLAQVACWGAYFLAAGAFSDFQTAAYFSAVTYSTVGYGDVLPPEWLRLTGGVLGLTGILMCGWSTAFFFAVVGRTMGETPGR